MLFSSVGTVSNKDNAVKNSATSSLINPNPNPTSTALLFLCAAEPFVHRSTPVGAVGPPRAKPNNSANADFQPTPKTQEAPQTTAQNLTSRICKLEKLFAYEIATFTSITAGIYLNNFSYMMKFANFNPAIQMLSFGRICPWSLYSTPKRWPDHHLILSLNQPQVLVVLSSGLTPMDTTSSSNSNLMVLDPQLARGHQFFHPLPWWLRQSASMALLKDHRHWYPWSTGPIEHLDENNSAWSRPGLKETHNLNKNRSCSNHH